MADRAPGTAQEEGAGGGGGQTHRNLPADGDGVLRPESGVGIHRVGVSAARPTPEDLRARLKDTPGGELGAVPGTAPPGVPLGREGPEHIGLTHVLAGQREKLRCLRVEVLAQHRAEQRQAPNVAAAAQCTELLEGDDNLDRLQTRRAYPPAGRSAAASAPLISRLIRDPFCAGRPRWRLAGRSRPCVRKKLPFFGHGVEGLRRDIGSVGPDDRARNGIE